MISIIVSSYQEQLYKAFSTSLEKTIGVPFELIKIDNKNKYSLTEAYNLGALEAKYDILCFVHEDIEFITDGWGQQIIDIIQNYPNIGLLGMAGSTVKSYLPTGWGTGISEYDRINIMQTKKGGVEYVSTKDSCFSRLEKIKVIDGVFICTTRSIFDEFKFDESVKGFHLYDIDFSLRVTQKYDAAILYDNDIIHYSEGGYNSDWMQATLDYHMREDKQHLFDHDENLNSLIRKSWYGFLVKKKVNRNLRYQYFKKMGVDIRSSFHAVSFLIPLFGKGFLFLLWVKQKAYKFVRGNKHLNMVYEKLY